MQKQMFSVTDAQTEKLELMPLSIIDQMTDSKQALSLSIVKSGSTHDAIANEIGKPRETLTRFLNGNGGLKLRDIKKLINATGNLIVLQFLARHFGYELKPIDIKAKRIAALEAELKELSA